MQAAAEQLRSAIAGNPRDGEAYYLLAKTLAALKDPPAAEIDNQAHSRLLADTTAMRRSKRSGKTKTVHEIRLRVQQPAAKGFRRRRSEPKARPQHLDRKLSETDTLLAASTHAFQERPG